MERAVSREVDWQLKIPGHVTHGMRPVGF